MPADQPVVRQGTAEAYGRLGVVDQRPVEGGGEVVVIGIEAGQPFRLPGAAHVGFRAFREPEEVLRVPALQARGRP